MNMIGEEWESTRSRMMTEEKFVVAYIIYVRKCSSLNVVSENDNNIAVLTDAR